MSEILRRIRRLVALGQVRISEHGYDELVEDGILATEVAQGMEEAIMIEDYPDYPKGPCVLVLQRDGEGRPIHALWGIPRGASAPAVLITAYRPSTDKWSDDFQRRRQ